MKLFHMKTKTIVTLTVNEFHMKLFHMKTKGSDPYLT